MKRPIEEAAMKFLAKFIYRDSEAGRQIDENIHEGWRLSLRSQTRRSFPLG